MSKSLSQAEINHLRRLLGYVRCEIGQSPDEHIALVRDISAKLGGISDYGQEALVKAHEKIERVPKYIRHAVKMLERAIKDEPGEIVDGEVMHNRLDTPTAEPGDGAA